MKQKPFVVLDRDGTIIAECQYLSDPGQVELLPGAAHALRQLKELGLGLVIITNQSGVGRGFFDHERLNLIHEKLCHLLKEQGVHLDGVYYCPHRPEDDCPCRKPRPGLLEVAARDLGFSPHACFVIGDQKSDIELGQQVGATTFLVRTGYGTVVAADPAVKPDYIADDLEAAARTIQSILATQGSLASLNLAPIRQSGTGERALETQDQTSALTPETTGEDDAL